MKALLLQLSLVGVVSGCGTPGIGTAPARPVAVQMPASVDPTALWRERFDRSVLDWVAPAGHVPGEIARVFHIDAEHGSAFLRARHDGRPSRQAEPPAVVHLGKAFRDHPVPLERVQNLRWRWRVLNHPAVNDEPWADLAASVYVVMKLPGLLPGRGFKFGWLAKPGAAGKTQRGLLQVQLRQGPPEGVWKTEQVDVCGLYRQHFGPCEGEVLLYVGVVTDGDDTHSLAAADYADFELVVRSGDE